MKTRRVEAAAGDANEQALSAAASFPFHIASMRPVDYGSKRAEFSIETPIAVIEADLFAPEGREAFVQARSVRCKYSGEWKRTTRLDRAFAVRVLDALRAQPPEQKEKCAEREPRRAEPSAALLEREQRFDDAFADLDGGGGAV